MIIWDCDYDDNKDRIISKNYVALKRERKPNKKKREENKKKKLPAQLNKLKIVKSWQKYFITTCMIYMTD